jgi:hypothetical protein
MNTVFKSNNRLESRTELIGDITVANQPAFNMAFNQSVNPANPVLFPWLSKIAINYDKYRFRKLQFHYKKQVSEYATAGTKGLVYMTFDYDATDPTPTTVKGMANQTTKCESMASQNSFLTCRPYELHANSNAKFVREGALPPQASLLDYDCGQLWVATDGVPENGKIGQLWVTYECEFSLPTYELEHTLPVNRKVYEILKSPFANYGQQVEHFQYMVFGNPIYDGLNIGDGPIKFNLPPGIYQIMIGAHFDATGNCEANHAAVAMQWGERGGAFGDSAIFGGAVVRSTLPIIVDGTSYEVNFDEWDLQYNTVWIEDGTKTLYGAFQCDYDGDADSLLVHPYVTIIAL